MAAMPHCDTRVLHAPSECEYCDRYPDWQEYRCLMRIAFTGHEPQPGELPCPSTATRSLEAVNRWPGNQARPPADTSWLQTPEVKSEVWMTTEEPKWRWRWRSR